VNSHLDPLRDLVDTQLAGGFHEGLPRKDRKVILLLLCQPKEKSE
jgi:hypothetical protein